MKRSIIAVMTMFLILSVTGCGHDHRNSNGIVSAFIISDPAFDGDIALDATGTTFTITQGSTQSVFAGIDPTNVEFRAFLDFPLTGAGGVPGNAFIDSAFLDIQINSIVPHTPATQIPIRIDLVDFQPLTLISSDFSRTSQPALASIAFTIFDSDFGQHVTVDVTSLMVEAQRLGLLDFQVRILEDLGPVTPGLIEITDTAGVNRGAVAPQLQVNYF
jgi:hypothetical protein